MYTGKPHRITVIFLCNLIEHSFCAYCPKIAPDSVRFCRALSAVALAQVNFAKNKQIEENAKPRLIAASQPK